ncbi:MAG: sugar phosphate nucleotidyltransferase [Actinomycetota bacterium]
MKALILAGGLGTRLRPLTETRPKHLLPIANVPHVEHVLDLLRRHGIHDVVLLTSYLAHAFDSVVAGARSAGMVVEVTHEREPLGTAGALKNAEQLVGGSTFLAFNGDVLTDVDLSQVLDFHHSRRAEATIVLAPVDDPSAYGVVPTAADGRVEGFIEKPPAGRAPTNLINAGIYVLEPSVLDRIPTAEVWSAERALFPGLVDEGARLYACSTGAYWMDIGTPAKYLQANLDALGGAYRAAAAVRSGDHVLCGPGAVVAERARVSWSCLGSKVAVAEDVTIERSVLLPGVAVGAGATISGSILGEDVRVAAGAQVVDRAVADGENVVP